MKRKKLLIAVTGICVAIFFISCTNDANIVKVNKDEYEKLKSDANKWEEVTKLSDELLARKSSTAESKNAMIDTSSAENYLLSYKNSKIPPPRPSAGIDFDKESIAFMMKYMLDNKINTVRAGFGIYSNVTSPKKDGYGTVIFGLTKNVSREEWEKNPTETAMTPFSYKKGSTERDSTSDTKGYLNWGDVSP